MSDDRNKELVVITGQSGLIGKRLSDLLDKDYQVVGMDPAPDLFPNKHIEKIDFDITKPNSINAALDRIEYAYGNKIASLVHLAAYYDFEGKESPMYDEITVKGTKKLLEAVKDRFEVKQFIFSSTNLVYQPCEPGEKIDEDGPLDPNWPYPESKVKTENIIKDHHNDIPTVIARIAGAYDEWGNSIPISHQVQRIYEKKITGHLYSGDTEKGSAFIHLDDLFAALKAIIDKREKLSSYEVFNIAEEKTFSYGSIQDKIGEELHGEEWMTIEVPKLMAKAGAAAQNVVGDPFIKPWMIDRADDHYDMDISKAKSKLDWKPKHNLMDTLEVMLKNLINDPEKWYKKNDLEISESIKEKS
ncbi:MAG: NAD-dependent epimerase/dehydratase family protein [Candidatus Cyclobacteriaceae bacterium M2_1C_046]